MAQRVLILGAAGRDFHNFNVAFRENPQYEVVAFTATQIPDIEGRRYPPALAGPHYPKGIPIEAEEDLDRLIADLRIDVAVFSYSDITHEHVMHVASRVMAAGADYLLLSPKQTQIESTKPLVSICAARTGCGKSQTSRRVAEILQEKGKKVVIIRHPMPYGDLEKQEVQRFETFSDLDEHEVTIEEREEYEPHLASGRIVFAGVDYEKILREAEKEADVVIWDGGNNDFSFYRSNKLIVVVDPHRADHALHYHPGEINVRMADAVVINKVDSASREGIEIAREVTRRLNPDAVLIEAASPMFIEGGEEILGKRVLVVEDGPTLTHGEMAFGAGWVTARKYGASEIVDPHPHAVGSIRDTYLKYPSTGEVLPAMGYSPEQIRDLETTVNNTPADLVLIATPIDLRHLIRIDKPALRVRYELQEIGKPDLADVLREL